MNAEQKISGANNLKLQIHYDRESDTLSLHNGLPAGYGEIVAEGLTAESNAERKVSGIVIEHAAELLRPYLFSGDDRLPVK